MKYAWQWLYSAIRKPVFLQFLNALLAPIVNLWDDFETWRTKQYYDLNITGQTFALQSHLNKLFDPVLERIAIIHYNDLAYYFPLSYEGYEAINISLVVEDSGIFISLKGEVQEAIGVSFQVYIPSELNVSLVLSELYKYKLAGRSFEVL